MMLQKDRHRIGYFREYRKEIIERAIVEYGNKCFCNHCITGDSHRPLKIILVKDKAQNQGQYGIALYLRQKAYKPKLAKLYCLDCYPTCNHTFEKSYKHETKKDDLNWWQNHLWKQLENSKIKPEDIIIPKYCPDLNIRLTRLRNIKYQLFNPTIIWDVHKGYKVISKLAYYLRSNQFPNLQSFLHTIK